MRRYVTLAEDWFEHREHAVAHTVYEAERTPRWSGLYDANGIKLYATEDRQPVGFRLAPAQQNSNQEASMKGTKKKPGKGGKGCIEKDYGC